MSLAKIELIIDDEHNHPPRRSEAQPHWMYGLGQLVAWIVILAILVSIAAIPALCAWCLWQWGLRVRRYRQEPESAYDAAYRRALESIARRNAIDDAERDVAALTRP